MIHNRNHSDVLVLGNPDLVNHSPGAKVSADFISTLHHCLRRHKNSPQSGEQTIAQIGKKHISFFADYQRQVLLI